MDTKFSQIGGYSEERSDDDLSDKTLDYKEMKNLDETLESFLKPLNPDESHENQLVPLFDSVCTLYKHKKPEDERSFRMIISSLMGILLSRAIDQNTQDRPTFRLICLQQWLRIEAMLCLNTSCYSSNMVELVESLIPVYKKDVEEYSFSDE